MRGEEDLERLPYLVRLTCAVDNVIVLLEMHLCLPFGFTRVKSYGDNAKRSPKHDEWSYFYKIFAGCCFAETACKSVWLLVLLNIPSNGQNVVTKRSAPAATVVYRFI